MNSGNEGAGSHRSQTVLLKDSIEFALEEARMVIPGIQALFGFQLMAVFNERFESALDAPQRAVHLIALLLVAVACALVVMAPAAYHRQAEQGRVSQNFLALASRLIGLGLIPLMLSICLDVYVVAYVVTQHQAWSVGLGAVCFAVLSGLWFALPWSLKRRRRSSRVAAGA